MYRVLLVDDEPWALVGIRRSFKWEEAGFEVIAETTNPLEALNIIFNECPDAVFTDIRMPEISGLEMIKRVRERGMYTEFIIISGFADFSYAQEALRQGAFDYFLKPLEIEGANKLLLKLSQHLKAKKNESGMELLEALTDNRGDTGRLLSMAGLGCTCTYYQALVVSYTDSNALSELEKRLAKVGRLVFNPGLNKHLYLVNSDTEISTLTGYVKIPGASVGISSVADSCDNISKLYREADMAAGSRLIYGKNGVFTYKKKSIAKVNELVERISKAVSEKNRDEVKNIFNGLPRFFVENEFGIEDLHYLWNQLAAHTAKQYANYAAGMEIDFVDYQQILCRFDSIDSLSSFLSDELGCLVEKLANRDTRHDTVNEGFKKLLEYVHEHYCEQLYLRELACKYYVNQTYCCDLFKKVTRFTFSEYLNKIRMEKSKELLAGTAMTIDEIAEQVGYNDYYYFNKVFKKFYNTTPSKYRKDAHGAIC